MGRIFVPTLPLWFPAFAGKTIGVGLAALSLFALPLALFGFAVLLGVDIFGYGFVVFDAFVVVGVVFVHEGLEAD